MRILSLILFSCFSLALFAQEQTFVPSDFAQNPKYYSAKISPDGKYLAIGTTQDGKRKLAVLDAKTFKAVGGTAFERPKQVGPFFWANNERLVVQVLEDRPWQEEPIYFGELFAMNYDGKKREMIFGYSVMGRQGSRIAGAESTKGWATIESFLKDDERNILISSTPMSRDGKSLPDLYKLDIYNGKMRKESYSPVPSANFAIDNNGDARFVMGLNDEGEKLFRRYEQDSNSWEPVEEVNIGDSFIPIFFDKGNENLYYLNDADTNTMGLFKFHLATGKSKTVFVDDKVDITQVEFTQDKSSAYAIRLDSGYPEYLIFNKEEPEAEVFRTLVGAFPGQEVFMTSRTKDNKKAVVYVSSDTSAGNYYLFDNEKMQVRFLFGNLKHLPEKIMSSTQPVTVKASDGVNIPAYLTLPVGAKKPVPLVTLVHGGPHGVRDYWGFDTEVQMLAHQGYAVLRVNYRGSGGYGHEFIESGQKQWGGRIQWDIIDATNWAREQPEINGDKVCIMGASFGGYSALQSSILASDVFDCAVANAGVYDLENLYNDGDIPQNFWGEAFLETVIGIDDEQLKAFSPVNHVDKLNAPVLIAHGEKDRRAPFSQAKDLRDAMDKAGKKYEWFVRASETHGFFDDKNRGEYYEKVASFLSEHLK